MMMGIGGNDILKYMFFWGEPYNISDTRTKSYTKEFSVFED